jgi:hypothetical protein
MEVVLSSKMFENFGGCGRKNAQKAQIKSLVTAYTVLTKPVYYLKTTTILFFVLFVPFCGN